MTDKNSLTYYKNNIILFILIIYVVLLGVGVAGEIFDIAWIKKLLVL